jgi:predicted transcriptional regulator
MRSSCRWQCPIRAAICSARQRALGLPIRSENEVRSVDHLAETCQADVDALYRLLRALASIGITEDLVVRFTKPGDNVDEDNSVPSPAAAGNRFGATSAH